MNKKFLATLRYSNKIVTLGIRGSIFSVQVNILPDSLENVTSVWNNGIFPHPFYHILYFLQISKSIILLCVCVLAPYIRCRYNPRVKVKSQGQYNKRYQIQRYIILQSCYNWFCHLKMLIMNIVLKWHILEYKWDFLSFSLNIFPL